LRIVRESGIQAQVSKDSIASTKGDGSQDSLGNLQELVDGISAFVEQHTEEGRGILLTHYLQEVSLLSDTDEDSSVGDDKVTLMTVHSAKGLEFDAVIVVGLEENLFPSQMSADNPRQIEEERRLFYVAMTRARHHLLLTFARSRMHFGRIEFSAPSRFLGEIDSRCLSSSSRSGKTQLQPRSRTASLRPVSQQPPSPSASAFSAEPSTGKFRPVSRSSSSVPSATSNSQPAISAGTVIAHDRFGRGVVERVEGSGVDAKATVRFDNAGTKQLLLRFARFTVVE